MKNLYAGKRGASYAFVHAHMFSVYGLVLLHEILYGEEGADMEMVLRPASQPFCVLSFCLSMRVAAVLQASKTVPARRAVAQS